MSETALEVMLDNSLTLGLYTTTPPPPDTDADEEGKEPPAQTPSIYSHLTQIGLARLITDYCTLAYLTDVYVLPAHRKQGHAAWLAKCVGELVTAMEKQANGAWRRTVLLTGDIGWARGFYGKWLDMVDQEEVRGRGVEFMSTLPKKGGFGGNSSGGGVEEGE